MSFSEQPNEMLDMLLNTPTIPLPQRIRLRAVSRRWLPVLEDGLARENTLVICDEVENYYFLDPKPDHLVLPGDILTEEFIRTLSRLFPSPTDLTLAFGGWDSGSVSWSTVPTLLDQLGTNLTSVKLYGYIDEAVAEPLARALADLSNLTSLTVDGNDFGNRLAPFLGPVLSRLEAFACTHEISPESASFISSSLSPRCTRLLLDHDTFDSLSGPLLSQLSASLMHLTLLRCDKPTLWESLSQMGRLTSLALGFLDWFVLTKLDSSLFPHFVPFARLTDLKLFDLTYRTPLALPSKMETPLSTIQRLTLDVVVYDSDDMDFPVDHEAFFKSIGVWFPALTKLTLIAREDIIPDIQASLGELSFAVETVDRRQFNYVDL